MVKRDDEIRRSWDRNAGNWTRAVRDGLIPSREAGTDRAILAAIRDLKPARLLDVGCGEGWLVRGIAELTGCDCVGVDGSAALVAAARAADPSGRYEVASYAGLIAGRDTVGAGFDVVVCNYSLFEADIAPLLATLRDRLSKPGAIVIQTLHPDAPVEGGESGDGWRVENFANFEAGDEVGDWAPMPWYARTLAGWHAAVRAAGLEIADSIEPRPGSGTGADRPPLSLILVCVPS